MIVEYLENKRTLRGTGAKKKYRYTRRVLLGRFINDTSEIGRYSI